MILSRKVNGEMNDGRILPTDIETQHVPSSFGVGEILGMEILLYLIVLRV